jgi:plastocyanin
MGRLPFLTAAGVAAVSAFGVLPSITLSAIGAPVDTARRAAISATPVAQTAEPVAVSIVEPPLKPPPTWTYEPKVVTVKVGTKVTWTNNGAVVHTATADDGKTFDSGNMRAKATFSFTPAAPGTFAYHCRQHPWMKGTIIVQP